METNKEQDKTLVRAEFEAWADGKCTSLIQGKFGTGYVYKDTAMAWEAWQAALSQRSEAVDAPSDEMVIRGAEVLHDSLRHAGCTFDFDHSLNGTEIQQGIAEAVFNAMIEVMQQKPAPAPSAAAGEQVPLTDKQIGELQYLAQTWMSETGRDAMDDWIAAQPTPAQGDAVPVALRDEDIVSVLHGCGIDTHPSKYGFTELQVSATSIPSIREVVRRCNELLATRQSSADAVDAARYRELRKDSQMYYVAYRNGDMGFAFSQINMDKLDKYIDAAIAAQGGKGE